LPDDGRQSVAVVHIVPLDRLGNVTDLAEPEVVTLRSSPALRILSPDRDGDPFQETFVVNDARGVEVLLDDSGGRYDNGNDQALHIEAAGSLMRIDVVLPDPDVDDSGLVDAADTLFMTEALKLGVFDLSLDLDGDGQLTAMDVARVADVQGLRVSSP
jgi:hypothetical protein